MRRSIHATIILSVLFLLVFCDRPDEDYEKPSKNEYGTEETTALTDIQKPLRLTLKQANNLAELPLACMQVEYPNKLGQTLGGQKDIREPRELHPSFYGCFDWHSAVHGHWSLVKLLKAFPLLNEADLIRSRLQQNITYKNIEMEVEYFKGEHEKSFERTYGWAWLLKLAEELYSWNDPLAEELSRNLQPLTDLIVQRYLDFLPKLKYPVRVGEHANTAFGLSFAWDYANTTHHEELKRAIETRAKIFYLDDKNCPLDWEPGGYDFLSPCLEEIDLMRRILNEAAFDIWIDAFCPGLKKNNFNLETGMVSDRADGKLVHLDGLNFSRAWVLYGLAGQYPEFNHLINVANAHVKYSLPNLVDDSYEGGHWLGSFAIYALDTYGRAERNR